MAAHIELLAQQPPVERAPASAVFGFLLDHVLLASQGESSAAEILAAQFRAQVDLIRALARPTTSIAVALRYICLPQRTTGDVASVNVVILVKVREEHAASAVAAAKQLAPEVGKVLRVLVPDQRWRLIDDAADFRRIWKPFEFQAAHIAEVRRREQVLDVRSAREAAEDAAAEGEESRVYVVLPFAPRMTSMARVLHLMLVHGSPLMLQVTIAPTELMPHEATHLRNYLSRCWPLPSQDVPLDAGAMLDEPESPSRFLPAVGSSIESLLMNQWFRLQSFPLLLSVSLAGLEEVPRTVAQAIGVEMTRPAGDEADHVQYTGRLLRGEFDVVTPTTDEDLTAARTNLADMSIRPWGKSLAPKDLRRLRYLVDPTEAAGAFRFPVATSAGELPGVNVRKATVRPVGYQVVQAMRSAIGDRTTLGSGEDIAGNAVPVFLTEAQRRQHVYVAGQTGTGKTTLLKTMILSDLTAGRGVAVLDPHGDLFAELLEMIPADRADDVVLLDPTDTDFPAGLNLLEAKDDAQRWRVVREMRAIMDRLLADQYGTASNQYTGPVFYQHMQMNMLLAMSDPESPGTLLEFHQIFREKDYWKRWLPLKWSDPQLKNWVEQILPKTDYVSRRPSEPSMGDYIASKFDEFLLDPMLRLIFGQKHSTINFNDVMDQGKILLVNLAKGAVTEANSRFLGMVLMAQLQAAAMRRVRLPREQRRLFCIYADEFQNLATENFGLLLSEARKFGVSLTLANQFTSQIRTRGLLDAVFGNVGTIIAFRVGRGDAEILAPYFGNAAALTAQPNHDAMVATSFGGMETNPFTIGTELPTLTETLAPTEPLRTRSRQRHGVPRALVLTEIEKSLQPPPAPPKAAEVPKSVETPKPIETSKPAQTRNPA